MDWPAIAKRVLAAGSCVTSILLGLAFSLPRVQSVSMSPTLTPGQHLFVLRTRWLNSIITTINRGDIVILSGPEQTEPYVKRIVALAGERIRISNGMVFINGHALHEPYAYYPDAKARDKEAWPYDKQSYDLQIPTGALFVMGDNRAQSKDSRTWGPLPAEEIVGKVIGKLR